MILDNIQIGNTLYILAAWGSVMAVVLWLGLVFWTVRDMRARSGSVLMRFLAACLVLFFFIPGVLVYLILRPRRTLEEDFQITLEEEALLQSIEEAPACPGCGRRIKDDWIVCPGCHTKLRKVCVHCNRLLDLPWNICPYCGNSTTEAPEENPALEQVLPDSDLDLDKALLDFDIIDKE
jgi:RNA polymerase subunit RPABC4/transcription elongation factor Spt4